MISPETVEVWAYDESRVGQHTISSRGWYLKGSRTGTPKQQEFESLYILGAINTAAGEPFGLILPNVGTRPTQIFVEELSAYLGNNRHIILLSDNAPWLRSSKLLMPSNITHVRLPPYSPELNPMENFWQNLKHGYLSNRCFDDYDDLLHSALGAWERMVAKGKDALKSLCSRFWLSLAQR